MTVQSASPAGSAAAERPRHHLLVAGTGRAGTSALVRYLTELGLETHITQHGSASLWDAEAQAGLENIPLTAITPDMPYVVKSAWSHQVVQQMLDDPAIVLDGVIIPVRNLVEAAASRTIRQLQAVHQARPWLTQTTTWEQWGMTPGGMIFSLNPIDEARLLAVGFHQLVERLVHADIPLVFLAFSRVVADAEYLHQKLAPLLADVTAEQARVAHRVTFTAEKIRVGPELAGAAAASGEIQGPTFQTLDNAALKREVARLRARLAEATARCETLSHERDALQERFNRQVDECAALGERVRVLRASRSWRFTRMLRLMSAALKGERPSD